MSYAPTFAPNTPPGSASSLGGWGQDPFSNDLSFGNNPSSGYDPSLGMPSTSPKKTSRKKASKRQHQQHFADQHQHFADKVRDLNDTRDDRGCGGSFERPPAPHASRLADDAYAHGSQHAHGSQRGAALPVQRRFPEGRDRIAEATAAARVRPQHEQHFAARLQEIYGGGLTSEGPRPETRSSAATVGTWRTTPLAGTEPLRNVLANFRTDLFQEAWLPESRVASPSYQQHVEPVGAFSPLQRRYPLFSSEATPTNVTPYDLSPKSV